MMPPEDLPTAIHPVNTEWKIPLNEETLTVAAAVESSVSGIMLKTMGYL